MGRTTARLPAIRGEVLRHGRQPSARRRHSGQLLPTDSCRRADCRLPVLPTEATAAGRPTLIVLMMRMGPSCRLSGPGRRAITDRLGTAIGVSEHKGRPRVLDRRHRPGPEGLAVRWRCQGSESRPRHVTTAGRADSDAGTL